MNPYRNEVEFTLGGQVISCRPTLQKCAEVEAAYGSAFKLLNKLREPDYSVGDLVAVATIILKGEKGAPETRQLPEAIFNEGALSFVMPIGNWLIAAGEPGEKQGEPKAEGQTAETKSGVKHL